MFNLAYEMDYVRIVSFFFTEEVLDTIWYSGLAANMVIANPSSSIRARLDANFFGFWLL